MAVIAPLRPVSRAKLVDTLGLLGVNAFALTAWSSPLGNRIALGLCLLALALSSEARSVLRKDPVFRFTLIFGLYFIAQAVWGAVLLPETLERQVADCGRWLLTFAFLAVAWWLQGDPKRISRVLMWAVLSLWLGLLRHVDLAQLLAFRTGQQTGFQMTPACSGLISAAVILGLSLFAGSFFRLEGRMGWIALRISAWLASLYLAAFMLVASQSRSAWMALAIVVPAVFGYQYWRASKRRGFSMRRLPYLPLLALALLIGGIVFNAKSILPRIGPDKDAAMLILQGRTEQLPQTSFTYRYRIQRFGIGKWLERPLAGWGTGSTKHLIRTSGQPELFNQAAGRWMGHLHNTYLEVLVRFGLFGAAFFIVAARMLAKGVFSMGQAESLPQNYFLFVLGSLALFGLWAFNDFQVMTDEWRAYWLLSMGLGYTFVLHAGKPSGTPES